MAVERAADRERVTAERRGRTGRAGDEGAGACVSVGVLGVRGVFGVGTGFGGLGMRLLLAIVLAAVAYLGGRMLDLLPGCWLLLDLSTAAVCLLLVPGWLTGIVLDRAGISSAFQGAGLPLAHRIAQAYLWSLPWTLLGNVLADPESIFTVPLFSNQYIPHEGRVFVSSTDWMGYGRRYVQVCGHPLFERGRGSLLPIEERFLREFEVDYVAVAPAWRVHVTGLLGGRSFARLLYDRDDGQVWEIDRTRLRTD